MGTSDGTSSGTGSLADGIGAVMIDDGVPGPSPRRTRLQQQRSGTSARPPPALLERYRAFVLKHRVTLHLLEDVLSRLILYAPSRFVSDEYDDGGGGGLVRAETLYAALNLWGLANDAVADGAGEGRGMTVGRTDEEEDGEAERWSHRSGVRGAGEAKGGGGGGGGAPSSRTLLVVLRSALAALECASPALEMAAGSSRRAHRNPGAVGMRHRRRAEAESRRSDLIVRLEWIKIACRMGILAANLSREYDRLRADRDGDDGVLCCGVLRDGGALRPGEYAVSAAEEEERLRRVLYVGRRTGRRVYGGSSSAAHRREGRRRGVAGWTESLDATSKLGVLALGEVLHVYRPLHWARSERRRAKRHFENPGTERRFELAGAWLATLVMDMLSHRLTLAAMGAGDSTSRRRTWRGIIPHGNGPNDNDRGDAALAVPTAEELRRRKARWMLYLLRSPMWDLLSCPVADAAAEGVSRFVPLVGRPLAGYVMELLLYWRRHHFMLEG